MTEIYMFDLMDTLVEAPQWDILKETDEIVRTAALQHASRRTLATSARILSLLDDFISCGVVTVSAIPGTRVVLEQLLGNAVLGIYSTSPWSRTLDTLAAVGYYDLFSDHTLIFSQEDIGALPKTDPTAFSLLYRSLAARGYVMRSYTDNNEKIIQAAVRSQAPIPSIYHLDKTSGLTVAEDRQGYIRIGALHQMMELHQNH